MADVNTNNDEKTPLNDADAVDPINDLDSSKAQFLNGGKDLEPHVAIEVSSGDDSVSFTGLGKEELMQYANDPFWKKVRLAMLIIFWIGWIGMLVSAIIIIVLAPRCPYRPDQKWYDKETTYEIVPQSFKDTSKEGEIGSGVGDINGITEKLGYLEDLGTKVLYVNSFYQGSSGDNQAVTDQKAVDPMLGTMADFDQLRKVTKKKEMRLILDFIPNHVGVESEWFKKSQKKEDPYTDYFIWQDCDSRNTKPNNWQSVKGGSAWTYDDVRKQCYLHQLESNKADLNLTREDVQKDLGDVLRFWLGKGVDGFHVQDVQYLVEDAGLGDETKLPGKTGNTYDDYDHSQTTNHPETFKILQSWKSILDSYNTKPGRERALIVTVNDNVNDTKEYSDAGATIVRVTPFSEEGSSVAEQLENKIKDVKVMRLGWMFGNKDSSRLASKQGKDDIKAMLTLQMTLPGIPFTYYGDEIGMTDSSDANVMGSDKYQTPMQWNSKGTGFSKNETTWIPMNSNFDKINVETENAIGNDESNLNVMKRLQKLRTEESFQWGALKVVRDGDVLMYTRKAEGFPGYLVALNLGTMKRTESFSSIGIPREVKVIFRTHSEDELKINLDENSYLLKPKHGVVLKYD